MSAVRSAECGRDALLRWIELHAREHANALRGSTPPLAVLLDFPDIADDAMRRVRARYEQMILACQELLLRGKEDGSVGVQSTKAALLFVFNILNWLPRWLSEVRPLEYDEAVSGLICLLRDGLASDPSRLPASPINRGPEREVDAVFELADAS